MSLITIPNTFTVGAVIIASQHNSNFSIIYADYNGNIDNTNLSASAAIADTKLSQITTASKISGAAITLLTSIPVGAGILPGANGGVPTGCIMMWSGTIATIPSGYVLCNGSNSTPDLRNLFIVGANADSGGLAKSTITGSASQSGGSITISQGNLPSYNLTVTGRSAGGDGLNFGTSATGGASESLSISSGGSGTAYTQPFYALALIMKT